MTVEAVREVVSRHREELAELGMSSLSVFGSVARGEAGPDSDVDLLVELNRRMGLFEFAGLKLRLAELLGAPVDLVMLDALKPRVRERVEHEAIRAA